MNLLDYLNEKNMLFLIANIILTLLPPTKNSLARAGFELSPSGFQTAALPIEQSNEWRMVASLIPLKWTKYPRLDLTLIWEDTQCFNSISEPLYFFEGQHGQIVHKSSS